MRETATDIRRRGDGDLFTYPASATILRIISAGSDSDGPVSVFTATVMGMVVTERRTVVAVINGLGHVTLLKIWADTSITTVRKARRYAVREAVRARISM